MKQLIERYQDDLEVRGFRPLTVATYVGCVRRFGQFAGHRPSFARTKCFARARRRGLTEFFPICTEGASAAARHDLCDGLP